MHIEVHGLDRLAKYLDKVERDLGRQVMVGGMRQATTILTRDAQRFAPADTRDLASSIHPQVFTRHRQIVGTVGTPKVHGPPQELGTRPYWPPVRKLVRWAERVGANAYLVARTISRRGIKAKRYLARSVEQNLAKIVGIFENLVQQVIK